jgi:biotin operon repressor
MTKQEAINEFGSAKDLALALGISEAAVSKWDDGAIPELRVYQIIEILTARLAAGDNQ